MPESVGFPWHSRARPGRALCRGRAAQPLHVQPAAIPVVKFMLLHQVPDQQRWPWADPGSLYGQGGLVRVVRTPGMALP